jgi:hypothetical protein
VGVRTCLHLLTIITLSDPYVSCSCLLDSIGFRRVLSTSSILRGLASTSNKTQTRKITGKTCKTSIANQSKENDPRWVGPIR